MSICVQVLERRHEEGVLYNMKTKESRLHLFFGHYEDIFEAVPFKEVDDPPRFKINSPKT
eukprot:1658293-Amphidinium_carterae.1